MKASMKGSMCLRLLMLLLMTVHVLTVTDLDTSEGVTDLDTSEGVTDLDTSEGVTDIDTSEGVTALPTLLTVMLETSTESLENYTFTLPVENEHTGTESRWMGLPLPMCSTSMSCKDRCHQDPTSFTFDKAQCADKIDGINDFSSTNQHYCHCNLVCWVLGDCCQDYFEQCLSLTDEDEIYSYLEFLQIIERPDVDVNNVQNPEDRAVILYKQFGTCTNVHHNSENCIVTDDIWLISRCPVDFIDDFNGSIVNQCENGATHRVFSFPVSHRWELHLVFKNVFCFMCHGHHLRDVTFWTVEIKCLGDETYYMNDWSAEDMKTLFDEEERCQSESWPRVPQNAQLRRCINADATSYSYVDTCDNQYLTNNSNSSSSSSNNNNNNNNNNNRSSSSNNNSESSGKMAAICKSYLRPLLLNDTVYSNIHCARCGHVSEEDATGLTCFSNFSDYQVSATNIFAEVEYTFNGYLIYHMGRVMYLSNYVNCSLSDSRSTFLGKCPNIDICPDKLELSIHPGFNSHDAKCAVNDYKYEGFLYYTDPLYYYIAAHSYRDLWVTLTYTDTSFSVDIMARDFAMAYQNVIKRHCGYCEIEDILPIQSININDESITILWPTLEPYITAFRLIKMVKDELDKMYHRPVTSSEIEISTYKTDDEICLDTHVVLLQDAFNVTVEYNTYVYSPTFPACVFDLEKIDFKNMVLNTDGNSDPMLSSFTLCWVSDLQTNCRNESPFHTSTAQARLIPDEEAGHEATQSDILPEIGNKSQTPVINALNSAAGKFRMVWNLTWVMLSAMAVVFYSF